MHVLTPARVAELLDAYLLADYRWELDGEWRWIRIGERAPEVEAAFPGAHCFALLSAWDPYSVPREKAVNRREDAELHRLIAESAYNSRAAFSSATDRSWREPSWLVIDLPTHELDALGRRFGQLGTVAWDRGRAVRLRMDAAPPPGYEAFPCVDWLK
jgi:hypothetical protein